jgi:hypothetical protein
MSTWLEERESKEASTTPSVRPSSPRRRLLEAKRIDAQTSTIIEEKVRFAIRSCIGGLMLGVHQKHATLVREASHSFVQLVLQRGAELANTVRK